MARVTGFAHRQTGRAMPVFTFVEAFAASPFDIVLHASSYQGTDVRYLEDTVLGYDGWTSADLLTYDGGSGNGGTGLIGDFEYGLFNKPRRELVGVQPTSIKIKRSDLTIVTITGKALGDYIEKTEYRYLVDGHLAIKVYLIDALYAQVADGDIVILEGCLLLQGGRQDLGIVNKKQVPFVLSGIPEGKTVTNHNPEIDVNTFLNPGASGDSNIGARVRVLDMGNVGASGIEWNSVRTKTKWLNGTIGTAGSSALPPQFKAAADEPVPITVPSDEHFIRQATYNRRGPKASFRKLDICRDINDCADPQGGRTSTITADNRGTRKPDQFSLFELHSGIPIIDSDNDGGLGYGSYAWKYVVGPTYQDPKYGTSFIPGASKAPFSLGGDFVPTGTQLLQTPAQGASSGLGYLDAVSQRPASSCENFKVHPQNGVYRSPYYPHAQSEFMHYVTYYKWESTNLAVESANNYAPTASANGSASAINTTNTNEFSWYASWVFQSTLFAYGVDPNTIGQTTLPGSDYSTVGALDGALIGEIGWQDFIANALHMSADPDNPGPHNYGSYISTAENQALVPAYDKLFSGVYHATRSQQGVYNLSRTRGLPTSGGAGGFTPPPNGPGSNHPSVQSTGGSVTNSLSSGRLYTYTVFIYAEAPQRYTFENSQNYEPWASSSDESMIDAYGAVGAWNSSGGNEVDHRVKYTISNGTGGSGTFPPTYMISNPSVNGLTAVSCIDKNSKKGWDDIYSVETPNQVVKRRNNSVCNQAEDYTRCGCKSVVEPLPLGELGTQDPNITELQRFETVIVYPRNIVDYESSSTETGGADSFPSLLYINSYFSVSGGGNAASGYAGDFLLTSTASDVHFRTTTNVTQTVKLSDYNGGNTNIPYTGIFQEEFLGGSDATLGVTTNNDTNTFTYKYFPGRDAFINLDELQFFTHDELAEARVFATIGGSGYNSPNTGDDIPHRHILMFAAENVATAGTDPRRAHVDLGWQQSWENSLVECSVLSLGTTTECSGPKENDPPYRIRKFVIVGDESIDLGFEDADGDGNPDNATAGCTDEDAINFNPQANDDDGSCYYCTTSLVSGVGTNQYSFMQAVPFLLNLTPGNIDNSGGAPLMGIAPATAIGNLTNQLNNVPPLPGGEIYEWQDGNLFNAINTSENALISGLTPGSPNTTFSYFVLKHDNLLDRVVAASNAGSIQQTTTTNLSGTYQTALNTIIAGSDPSDWVCQIYTYEQWEQRIAPASTYGNGWAVESNGDGSTVGQTNVYYDIFGNYSGIGLAVNGNGDPVTAVASLSNQATAGGSFYFSNFDPSDLSNVTDIGLKAGQQYVAVLRFHPRRFCGDKSFYYFAYNFFVEYCECTDPLALDVGNYADATNPPWVGTVWEGESFYPGVNMPADQVNTSAIPNGGSGALPSNFCVTGEVGTTTGLLNNRICEYQGEDESVSCANFYSWCLTDIRTDCVGPDADGNVYGEVNFEVLIDGFFVQSDPGQTGTLGDSYQLEDPETGFAFYYLVTITIDGVQEEQIASHVIDGGGYVPNPDIVITTQAQDTFQGAIAVITAGPYDFDQGIDGSVGEATVQVTLQATHLVNNSGDLVPLLDVVDYLVDSNGDPVNTICPPEPITYVASAADCEDLVFGCMDETAINFNPNANSDDGSCEYIPCEEVFNEALNSVFITDVDSTPATMTCTEITPDDGGDPYNTYVPNYDGTMTITVQDFSASSPSGALGNNTGNFTLFVYYMGGQGNINAVGDALAYYDANAALIQGLGEGEFESLPGQPGAFIGVGDMQPDTITNGDPFGIGESLTGAEYDILVPIESIFTGAGNNLTGGQYLIFLIPHIDITSIGDGYGGLEDCVTEFGQFADDQTYHVIDMTTNTDDCPQPCNQFVNPDDCPNNVNGCTDPGAENYDPEATIDDGTCVYCVTCDFCDLYPTHPECQLCDKRTDDTVTAGSRGFSESLRDCEGGDKCCADQTATNYDPECRGENADNSKCTYACNGVGCTDCEDDPTGESCVEDPCPDPNNPDCVNPPVVNCLETGDCPCVGSDCNPECLLNPELCNPGQQPCEQSVANNECDPIEQFTTTTIVCNPIFDDPALSQEYNADWLTNVLMSCASGDALKYMFRLKAGIQLDDVDTTKLALIAYLFIEGSKNNLDCLFDCDNYESGVRRDGKVRGFSNRMKETDCNAKWASGRYQRFAASSTYRKGTTVKYTRMVNGVLASSFYTAKSDWSPGMALPGITANKKDRVWEACINVKFQSGGNPENYFQTFVDFIKRYCDNCEIDPFANSGIYESNEGQGIGPNNRTQNFGGNSTIGFQDEDGNEIIF